MTSSTLPLMRAVTYTPAYRTHTGWAQLDVGLLREQLGQLAELGTSHIVLQPSWFRLQPQATRISTACMRIIEDCLDAAHHARLGVVMSLLAVTEAGAVTMPRWHTHADVIGWLQGRTTQPISMHGISALIDGHWGTLQAADPFRTEALVTAQHLLLRTVMGYFASHPTCDFWMLGAGWSRLPAPTTTTHAQQWWHHLCEVALDTAPGARLMSHIDAPTVMRTHPLHLDTLTTHCQTVMVDVAMPELTMPQQRRLSTPAVFCVDVVHALSQKPVVVRCAPLFRAPAHAHWQQVPWHQHGLDVACVTQDDSGPFVSHLLQRLHVAGAAGIVWPQGIASPVQHDDLPIPWLSQQLALYDAHGGMNDVGEAWRTWSRTLPTIQQVHTSIDTERFWHNPVREFARLWHAYA